MKAAEQYDLVQKAELYQMPAAVTALTVSFDKVLGEKKIKTYPDGHVLTTIKMRTKFQAQSEKEGELSAVHKDFVILPEDIVVQEAICGGRMEGAAQRLHAFGGLLAQAADHLPSVAVVEREQQRDQAAGGQAAERAVALHQGDLCATACGRDRSRDPGAAAADDEHIGVLQDGGLAFGFTNRCVRHEARRRYHDGGASVRRRGASNRSRRYPEWEARGPRSGWCAR